MDTKSEREKIYVKIDESGTLVEASYLPMVGSRISPVPVVTEDSPRTAHFELDSQGTITGASVQSLNGRKILLYHATSPALGRTDTATDACTWKPDAKGDWVCV